MIITAAALAVLLVASGPPAVVAQDRDQDRDREHPVQVVPSVNLDRYMGQWFEVARLPNEYQEECLSDVRATYVRRDDGEIDVLNQCRTAEGLQDARGVARLVDETTRAKLEVRFAPGAVSFLPWVWGDYWVIGLADDYSWATVGAPDRETLWILSRTPELGEADFTAAVAAARKNGFDVGQLVRTKQDPRR